MPVENVPVVPIEAPVLCVVSVTCLCVVVLALFDLNECVSVNVWSVVGGYLPCACWCNSVNYEV